MNTNDMGPAADDQRVRDFMTAAIQVCQPQTSLDYVARMMAQQDVGAIPVVESTETMKPVGIITDRDIVLRAVAKRQAPASVTAGDCMSSALLTVSPDLPIDHCVRQMEQRLVRRAPVVDESGRCIGIISQADIAGRARPQQVAELVREISEAPGYSGEYH